MDLPPQTRRYVPPVPFRLLQPPAHGINSVYASVSLIPTFVVCARRRVRLSTDAYRVFGPREPTSVLMPPLGPVRQVEGPGSREEIVPLLLV